MYDIVRYICLTSGKWCPSLLHAFNIDEFHLFNSEHQKNPVAGNESLYESLEMKGFR